MALALKQTLVLYISSSYLDSTTLKPKNREKNPQQGANAAKYYSAINRIDPD